MTNQRRPAARAIAAIVSSAAVTCGALAPLADVRAADQMVLFAGIQEDYGDRTNRNPSSPFGNVGYTIDDLCAASGVIGHALETLVSTVDQAAQQANSPITLTSIEMIPGAPRRENIRDALAATRDGVCNQPDPGLTVRTFLIAYAPCRMTMVSYADSNATRIDSEMIINIPPGGQTVEMWMMEGGSTEVIAVELNSSLQQMPNVVGRGWSDDLELISSNRSEQIGRFDTRVYTFDTTGGLGDPDEEPITEENFNMFNIGPDTMGNMVTVQSTGTVWSSDTVPGIDIARSFYENMTSTVQSVQGAGFFSGLIKNTVLMLEEGVPIKVDETTRSTMMGRTSVSGRTVTTVYDTEIVDLNPGYCGLQMQIPEGYTEVNINDQISDALAESGLSSEELAQAMQQVTPEQQAALESMGMGDMLAGMMGGAAPGGLASGSTGSTQTPTPGSASTGSSSGTSSSGSSMPPAEELEGGSMIETVQKHLQALGYEVGEVNGESSMETMIAISTFQAEKGMEVTGEVSPQLLGVLSAEVDGRRP